jgi:DNA repair exonuclease SbcCD ATPase subunit
MRVNKLGLISVVVISVVLGGCSLFFDEEKAQKEVLSEDPSFLAILKERNENRQKIDNLKNALSEKEKVHKSRIAELEREFRGEKRKIDLEMKTLENEIARHRQKIRVDLSNVSQRLKSKRKILGGLNSNIKETKNLLSKSPESGLSYQERSRWQQRLTELTREREEISREREALEKDLKIEKLKLKLLKK